MNASAPAPARNRAAMLASTFLVLLAGTLIAWSVVRAAHQRGLTPAVAGFLSAADQIHETGSPPPSALYPPLVPWIARAVRAAGGTTIHPFLFNFCFFAAGLVMMLGMARQFLKHEWLACAAVLLALLNPYFAWTALLSKDTGAELLFLGALLWLVAGASERTDRRGLRGVGIVAAAALLTLTRVTGAFIALAVLLLAFWISREQRQKQIFAWAAGAFVAFLVAFCAWNQARVGAFTLATNGGYNLWLGNHPAYLHAHPHYDVDVFLRPIDRHDELADRTEADRNREYTKRALEFIRADPAAFVYRLIMKSIWHWFNVEKIPNYTSASEVEPAPGREGWEAHLGPIRIGPSLAYLLYKLAYLPVFLYALVAIARHKLDRRFALLYGPLLGLWPVVALTFPDTRFKICAEVIVLPALVGAACLRRRAVDSANSALGKDGGVCNNSRPS